MPEFLLYDSHPGGCFSEAVPERLGIVHGFHKKNRLMIHEFSCPAAVGLPAQHPVTRHMLASSKGLRVASSHLHSVQGSNISALPARTSGQR